MREFFQDGEGQRYKTKSIQGFSVAGFSANVSGGTATVNSGEFAMVYFNVSSYFTGANRTLTTSFSGGATIQTTDVQSNSTEGAGYPPLVGGDGEDVVITSNTPSEISDVAGVIVIMEQA